MIKTSGTARENAVNLLIIFAMLTIAFGCFCGDKRNRGTIRASDNSKAGANNSSQKSSKKGDTKADPTSKKSDLPDNGDFLVEYVEVQDTRYQDINDSLRQQKFWKKLLKI